MWIIIFLTSSEQRNIVQLCTRKRLMHKQLFRGNHAKVLTLTPFAFCRVMPSSRRRTSTRTSALISSTPLEALARTTRSCPSTSTRTSRKEATVGLRRWRPTTRTWRQCWRSEAGTRAVEGSVQWWRTPLADKSSSSLPSVSSGSTTLTASILTGNTPHWGEWRWQNSVSVT